eukprot:TRINITY_DN158_c1_g1_i1.p1 TRINITY_DN158_c1_g1~~TRINITY_DN158_c1_g1_i1.p1  ORF type:complete len:305 (+),score=132.98 TRINITY_DN158_c1_g1_i1:64-915(+)
MGVKYGDIAKDTKDVFEKDFYDSVKIEDKIKTPDNKICVLPKWDNGFATKWVYKWGLPAEAKAEATCECAKKTATNSLKVTKGPWQVTGKVEGCDKYTSEVQVTEDVAGATLNTTVKSNLTKMEHSADLNVAYTHKVNSDTKVQVGAKAAVSDLTKINPTYECALGLYSAPGNFAVGYNVDKQTLKTYSVFGVPVPVGGFSWKLGHLLSMKNGAMDNMGAVVVGKKGDLTVKAKVEQITSDAPQSSLSLILNSKPVEKETITTVATWGFHQGSHKFGFSASRS